jgi:hypothetical protein
MKKIVIIIVLFASLVTGNVFGSGWAIGGDFAFNWSNSAYATGAALCVKFPQLPVMFGFSANLATPLVVGITADWWLFQSHLVGPVEVYIGPGLFLGFNTGGGNGSARFGIRIPVGFQIFIVKAFEIFIEPAVSIELVPTLPEFGIQAALGFRFWF